MYTEILQENLIRVREKLELCDELEKKYPDEAASIEQKRMYWKDRVTALEQDILAEVEKQRKQKEDIDAKKKETKQLQDKYGTYFSESDYRHIMNKKSDLEVDEEHEKRKYFAEKYGIEIPAKKMPRPSLDEAVAMLELEMLDAQTAAKLGLSWDDVLQQKHALEFEVEEEKRFKEFAQLMQEREADFSEAVKNSPEKYALIDGESVLTDTWKEVSEVLKDTVDRINKRMENYFEIYCNSHEYQQYHQEKLNAAIVADESSGPDYFREKRAAVVVGDTRIGYLRKLLGKDPKFKIILKHFRFFNREYNNWVSQYDEDK